MLRFRDEGVGIYDFGGWYPGRENEILLRINRFKESFGGELVLRYDCDQARTWKGALGLGLLAATDAIKPLSVGRCNWECFLRRFS
jgi:hypothetical protein